MRPGQQERQSLKQRKFHHGAEPEGRAALLRRPRLPSGLEESVLGAGCAAGLQGVCLPLRRAWEMRASAQDPGLSLQSVLRGGGLRPYSSAGHPGVSPGGTGLCPRPQGCTFVPWPLLPSLIGYCWNLHLGGKRRPRRLNPFSRKKWGNAERFPTREGPTGS